MKLFTACLGTETNSFSPIPTGLDLFAKTMLVRNGAFGEQPGLFGLPLVHWRSRAHARGWTVVEGTAAFAMPAGTTTRTAYESLRNEILDQLRAALPVDAVLLNLHGAMIADGYPDAEGDLLTHVRRLVGPTVPIACELDLHCHLTAAKVAASDIMVIYKEYPHVDVIERAEEVWRLLEARLMGTAHPVLAWADCAMLGLYPTTREPVRGFVDRMTALEGQDGILSVSLAHGFPWGDTPEVGTRVLVCADGDRAKAQALADRLAAEFRALGAEAIPPYLAIDAALDRARGRGQGKPVVLADVADNPGIGAAGDSTWILKRLLERGEGGAAVAPLWDPSSVAVAWDAGMGARIAVRIGGKLGPASGQPLDVEAVVVGLSRQASQPFGGAIGPLGDMATLRIGTHGGPVDVVVNTYRTQGFHPDCFAAAGCDPHGKRVLVVKSSQHFYAGFAPIAAEVIYVGAPGTGSTDFANLPLTTPTRALWPRNDLD
ncbi:MAG: M81 family peptidase [Alphaproteobacteria bacterium]|nr:MAG: M81 family peptidase [Alphaproteobacteria bacterium]